MNVFLAHKVGQVAQPGLLHFMGSDGIWNILVGLGMGVIVVSVSRADFMQSCSNYSRLLLAGVVRRDLVVMLSCSEENWAVNHFLGCCLHWSNCVT